MTVTVAIAEFAGGEVQGFAAVRYEGRGTRRGTANYYTDGLDAKDDAGVSSHDGGRALLRL